MIISKVYRSWKHVGPMPLFRALIVDGAIYYIIFILAFGLEIVANTSNVVGRFHFTVSNRPSLVIALLPHSGYQVRTRPCVVVTLTILTAPYQQCCAMRERSSLQPLNPVPERSCQSTQFNGAIDFFLASSTPK